jgi:hypothetical protein
MYRHCRFARALAISNAVRDWYEIADGNSRIFVIVVAQANDLTLVHDCTIAVWSGCWLGVISARTTGGRWIPSVCRRFRPSRPAAQK